MIFNKLLLLYGALAGIALGKGSNVPTADDPCGVNSDVFRWKVNTTEHLELMRPCAVIDHTLWIGNNFQGVFSLPNLVNVSNIYIGDAFYDDQTQTIASGTLTGVSFPALKKASEILAVNLASINLIDVPNLVDGYRITLSGLPALTNFSLSSNYAGSYINITSSAITEFSYGGSSLSGITLTSNPSLEKVTISDDSAIGALAVDCGGMVTSRSSFGYKTTRRAAQHPMPRFTGPKDISSFEVRYCKQPSGDWKTALASVGSIKAYSMKFHENEFVNLSLPNLKNISSSLQILKNDNLTEIAFPSLTTIGELTITDNPSLLYINATAFPVLTSINYTSSFDGAFKAITLPPRLAEGYLKIESSSSSFNCTLYDEYSSSIWSTKQRVNFDITVSCTKPVSYGGGSSGSGSGSGSGGGVKIRLKPKIIVAIVVPIVSTTFWAIVLWCLCHRRRKRRAKQKVEMAALQAQIQGLAQPIQQLANGQQVLGPGPLQTAPPYQNSHVSMLSQPPVSPVSAMSEVAHPPKTATVTTSHISPNGNLAPTLEPTPASTILSREEMLDARERALQERERQLEQDALDARERALLAREQEIASLEVERRN